MMYLQDLHINVNVVLFKDFPGTEKLTKTNQFYNLQATMK